MLFSRLLVARECVFCFGIMFVAVAFLCLVGHSLCVGWAEAPVFIFAAALAFSVVGGVVGLFAFPLLAVVKFGSYTSVPLGVKRSRGGSACAIDCLFRRSNYGMCHFCSGKGCICFAAEKSMADVAGSSATRHAVAVGGAPCRWRGCRFG